MGYDEFRRQLGRAGISAREFAALLKLHPNSITNYARGRQVPTHLAVIASLMGEMADNGLDYRSVVSRIGIEPNKPRGAGIYGQFGGDKQVNLFPPLGQR